MVCEFVFLHHPSAVFCEGALPMTLIQFEARWLIVALVPAVFACSAVSDEGLDSARSHAIVSRADANTAFEIVRGIDYLPFGHTRDGCHARALYMSMAIAAEGIPTSAQYIHAKWEDDGILAPTESIRWNFHVAPMVQIGTGGTPMILDPSLFTGPVIPEETRIESSYRDSQTCPRSSMRTWRALATSPGAI
jgi:hypothetical protein